MRRNLVAIVTGIVFVFFLWWKLNLGVTRYFDADEFAYLHWAHNVFAGKLPYRDFLLYVPPGFLYLLAPLFGLFSGTAVLIAGRVLAWMIFVGICIALGMILVELRGARGPGGVRLHFAKATWGNGENLWLLLLPGLILSFLPMPADKFLEIRPDNLAILLAILGMVIQIKALGQPKENQPRSNRGQGLALKLWGWAGVLYGVSLLVLPKTLPQIAFAATIAFFAKGRWRFFSGLMTPLVLFGLWAVTSGYFPVVWYSLTKLPFEVNRIAHVFPMQPDLFFYPNATYYGQAGWSMGLLVNHGIWLFGLMVGVVRLMTPWLGQKKRELLVAGSMMAYVVTFMYGYPLRHAQYLIPIAVFVAFYAADGVALVVDRVPKVPTSLTVLTNTAVTLSICGVVWFLVTIFLSVNRPKVAWTNSEDLATLKRVRATIPSDAYVFDLTGATIFYRDPYYVSAVAYGHGGHESFQQLPSLSEALEQTDTRYVYQGKLERVKTLTFKDQSYITSHFTPAPGFGTMLLK